ncbi:MAG: RNA polymerase factor sigma-54 [Aquificae bacterium]|nr:RNA polymerase factor sigma-54 [Aquificota bacterium]
MKPSLQLKLKPKLKLTPSLKHQLALLMLPKLELEQTVKQELEENPFLEEILNIESQTKEPIKDLSTPVYSDDEENYRLKTLAYKPSLYEIIEAQIDLEFDGKDKEIAKEIVANIDEKGFLETPVENIAEKLKVSSAKVEEIRKKITKLEPLGIATKDIKEFLKLQIKEYFGEDELIEKIIDEDIQNINNKELLSQKYNLTQEEIEKIIDLLRCLIPYPTYNFDTEASPYIEPDIFIYEKGDDFEIEINETGIPKLKLTNQYRKLISKKDLPANTKKFLEEKLQKAIGIIKGIEQRRENLKNIVNALVEHQKEFLRKGKTNLKPLKLKDIAQELGLHESTVSRIISGKYAQTPIGVIPLKAFFSRSLSSDTGDISTEKIKLMIKDIIENEDKTKPLSDEAIAKILQNKGINIARRTIAKYRQELKIPGTRKRRVKK